ncbi:MAG: anthranilate synthase component I [Syntrophus sp. (in: bacteria)]|nr:anthranilate synthase component I [Syntrophus sp. (in: bacteria)]
MYPTFKTFKTMTGQADRVNLYREVGADMDTPVSILSKLISLDRAILLESAKGDKTYSRFSFLAFDIEEKLCLKKDGLYKNGEFAGDLSSLEQNIRQVCAPSTGDFGDFCGGYVGYLNYEFVEACGILRRPLVKENGLLGVLYLIEKWLVYDNYTNKAFLALSKRHERGGNDPEGLYQTMSQELDAMAHRLTGLPRQPAISGSKPSITRMIPKAAFKEKVAAVKGMIEEGEAIQVVLSDHLEVEGLDPFDFYRNLRRINPSPYMYFLKDGDFTIVGSSPEVHVKITDRKAVLKPIAGTKPRNGSDDVDGIIKELSSDEKERAEHLMLVDLARNDLSRICTIGSVAVKTFMEPEVYSHVVHLVSHVEGELAPDISPLEAVKRTFPAGTVSGAPKTRAIEIIDEMEDAVRGPYAGCLGYLGFNGNVNMAITIRTAYFTGQKARLQAGAGIVYDSIPEKEYEEVLNKLGALIKSGGMDDTVNR